MKYIKLFTEKIETSSMPLIGDYVLVKYGEEDGDQDKNLEKCVGEVVDITRGVQYPFSVNFEEYGNYIFSRHEIIHHSKNKEDLETILTANKYNL